MESPITGREVPVTESLQEEALTNPIIYNRSLASVDSPEELSQRTAKRGFRCILFCSCLVLLFSLFYGHAENHLVSSKAVPVVGFRGAKIRQLPYWMHAHAKIKMHHKIFQFFLEQGLWDTMIIPLGLGRVSPKTNMSSTQIENCFRNVHHLAFKHKHPNNLT